MKNDNQHLDFLISQYVDGTLDGANRKLIEQQLAGSAEARRLLKEHREAQDLLDDYGSRIPLIDWSEFDQTLAVRLNQEAAVAARGAVVRRWTRPLATAAALFLAAGVGYAWHAWSQPAGTTTAGQSAALPAPVTPVKSVRIVDRPEKAPFDSTVATEGPPATVRTPGEIVIGDDSPSIKQAVSIGTQPGSVTATQTTRPESPDVPQ